jgi:hypothetical protein
MNRYTVPSDSLLWHKHSPSELSGNCNRTSLTSNLYVSVATALPAARAHFVAMLAAPTICTNPDHNAT